MGWIRGAYIDGAPTGTMPEQSDAFQKLGDERYAALCVRCHGEAGDGRGPDALHPPGPPAGSHAPGGEADPGGPLDPRPRDFTKAVYKLRSTPTGKLPTDADLFRSISAGLHGSAMLPFVVLDERERWALVAKIKRFSTRFDQANPAKPFVVPAPPEETKELVERGRALFVELGCIDCHGKGGTGDGKRAAELKDAAGHPISPRNLTQGRFRRGTRMADLYLTIKTGLDGTPMASFEAYPDDQLWAVAAFVRSLVDDPVHRQNNPPVHPQERLGLRIGMRALLAAAGP
jgi:cytochrome c oxidase cbb3-type subunit 2